MEQHKNQMKKVIKNIVIKIKYNKYQIYLNIFFYYKYFYLIFKINILIINNNE